MISSGIPEGTRNKSGSATTPFAPTDVTGIKLWLKSDIGVTEVAGVVSQWDDQSGEGNNVVQATEANKPLEIAAVLDGFPAIRFDGTNDNLELTTYPDIANEFTAYVVYKISDSPSGIYELGTGAVNSGFALQQSAATTVNLRIIAGGSQNTTYVNALPYGFVLSRMVYDGPGTASQMLENEVSKQTGVPGAAFDNVISSLDIGTLGGGTWPGNMDLIELVFFHDILSAGDLTSMSSYFDTRYPTLSI